MDHTVCCIIIRGQEKFEQLPSERFFQGFEFSRALLPPVSHGEKREKFQNPVKKAHKAAGLLNNFRHLPQAFVSNIFNRFTKLSHDTQQKHEQFLCPNMDTH